MFVLPVTSARPEGFGGTNVRFLALALAVALAVMTPFRAPPVVRADGAADDLPTVDELTSTLAPLSVGGYTTGPGKDGWDATSEFDINGSPDGLMHSEVDVSMLTSKEGAAGFLQ